MKKNVHKKKERGSIRREMLNDGKTYIVRIDGNSDYTYMKDHIRIIDNEIFILSYNYDEDYYSLDHLCKQYIRLFDDRKWIQDLYQLLLEHKDEVINIVNELDTDKNKWKTREVETVKGLTVSNY